MIDPSGLAARARVRLREAADPRIARRARTYFKQDERVTFLGVATPGVREIEKGLFGEVKGVWKIDDAISFCDRLVTSPPMEEKNVGMFLLSRFRRSFDVGVLRTAKAWLAGNHCANWAATDALCGLILGPLLLGHPDLIPAVARWSISRNVWIRRASAVALVPLARRGAHLDTAYEVAASLFGDDEDLIHKATGWLLREAGRSDTRRLEAFLLACGPAVPRTAVRYAIERFPVVRRKRILTLTRATLPRRGIA